MRSATLLAFVDWRPSAVKRVILSGVGWLCHWRGGSRARPRARGSAGGAVCRLCIDARPRAALPAPRQALYPPAPSRAAPSGFVLAVTPPRAL